MSATIDSSSSEGNGRVIPVRAGDLVGDKGRCTPDALDETYLL
jgi:hypothetical protein